MEALVGAGLAVAIAVVRVGRLIEVGVIVALGLGLTSCGGSKHRPPRHAARTVRLQTGPSRPRGPAAHIPRAAPVTMTGTPRALLTTCLNSPLLRPICPRQVPAANLPHTEVRRLGACIDASGHDLVVGGRYAPLDRNRCVEAVWGFEAAGLPSGYVPGAPATIRGWDPATKTLASAESGLVSPPAHVHVEIEASTRAPIESGLGGGGDKEYHAVSDELLSTKRTQPVSLGWVRWSGRYGHLVLDPMFPSGGEWGGHLIFYFTAGRTDYAITLHAWLPAIQINQGHATRTIRLQAGPSLPHVVATLKMMVDTALGH